MNILVCMKQVFDDSVEVGYNEAAQAFTPAGIEKIENDAADVGGIDSGAELYRHPVGIAVEEKDPCD